MSDAPPRPREVFDILGGEGPERAFLSALERGRLHHAWLLVGPEGVGKATFAYRAARRLLGAAPAPEFGLLGAAPEDPVCRQIMGRAHPDLLALQRDPEDGKARKGIPVDEARRLLVMARGAPGRAWALAAAGALAIDEAARGLLDGLPAVDEAAALALADGFRGAEGAERFNLLFDRLADQVHARSAGQAANGAGGGRAAAWAEAWNLLTDLPRQAEGINLDRADAFFTMLTRLKAIGPC